MLVRSDSYNLVGSLLQRLLLISEDFTVSVVKHEKLWDAVSDSIFEGKANSGQ